MTEKLYIKFSLDNREPRFGSLPMPAPGESATESRGALLCRYGWHACLPGAGGEYVGTEAYLVRLGGETQSDATKVCGATIETVSQLPWTRYDMVAFAQSCAERARGYAAATAPEVVAAATAASVFAATASAYAAYAAAASAADAAAAYAASAAAAFSDAEYERAAQWRWILDRLVANGADLANVEGA